MSSGRPSIRSDASPVDIRRRSIMIRQSNLVEKHGKRHHAFDAEKAPYPLCYDRPIVDLDIMDHVFHKHIKKTVSFVDFKNGVPTRSLDLGCGTGSWVLDAAKEWPQCEFVGFDLVNIQPALNVVDASISDRISWHHGNFLTTKLPFDDDEFDHVHIRHIARAVPENKWDNLFEEVSRVLKPGGAVEMIEEDIRFPTLPRWYTSILRTRQRRRGSINIPSNEGGMRSSDSPTPPPTPPPGDAPHEHVILESLHNSVYESRFINLKPTAILPSYFSTYFRQVQLSPVINFPLPPFPSIPTLSLAASRAQQPQTNGSHHRHTPLRRPRRHRQPSIAGPSDSSPRPSLEGEKTPNAFSDDDSSIISQVFSPNIQPYFSPPSDDAHVGNSSGMALLPVSRLVESSEFALALSLHRTYNLVLACQESMWEMLNDLIRNREERLKELGWFDDDLEGRHSRQRFDKLIERYTGDMQTRTAIWQLAVQSLRWKIPPREPLSKAEALEEERLFQSMLHAKEFTSEHDSQSPCRTFRIFVGFKASTL